MNTPLAKQFIEVNPVAWAIRQTHVDAASRRSPHGRVIATSMTFDCGPTARYFFRNTLYAGWHAFFTLVGWRARSVPTHFFETNIIFQVHSSPQRATACFGIIKARGGRVDNHTDLSGLNQRAYNATLVGIFTPVHCSRDYHTTQRITPCAQDHTIQNS